MQRRAHLAFSSLFTFLLKDIFYENRHTHDVQLNFLRAFDSFSSEEQWAAARRTRSGFFISEDLDVVASKLSEMNSLTSSPAPTLLLSSHRNAQSIEALDLGSVLQVRCK